MKCLLVLMSAVVLCGVLSGCSDKYESAMEDQIGYMKEMNSILASVKDDASAEAARPRIEAVVEKMNALAERMQKIGKPSKEREAELKKKYEAQLKEVTGELMGNMMKLMSHPELQEAFKGMKKPKL